MGGEVLRPAFPRRRVWLVVLRNGVRYLFRGAVRSWTRNLGTIAPALGSMTILLLLSGFAGLGWYTLRSAAARASADAAVLHVYLRDDANQADVDKLRTRLGADTRVSQVSYVSKAEALKRAARRPGLPDLTGVTDSNPFPASLDLTLRQVQDVGTVAATVQHDPAVDPLLATSYEPGTYQRLQTVLTWVGIGGAVLVLLLAFVAVTVTANGVRAAVHARRDEVMIMQLVGARRWMVRGPFVIEGALTGAVAGTLAGIFTLALGLAAVRIGAANFAQIAPGLTGQAALLTAVLIVLVGVALGSGSSLLGLRRHLEN
jgi:cell division transport system permease protein